MHPAREPLNLAHSYTSSTSADWELARNTRLRPRFRPHKSRLHFCFETIYPGAPEAHLTWRSTDSGPLKRSGIALEGQTLLNFIRYSPIAFQSDYINMQSHQKSVFSNICQSARFEKLCHYCFDLHFPHFHEAEHLSVNPLPIGAVYESPGHILCQIFCWFLWFVFCSFLSSQSNLKRSFYLYFLLSPLLSFLLSLFAKRGCRVRSYSR